MPVEFLGIAATNDYCLWGEPLASTAEQIESVKAAGRTDVPKIQVAFRPIIAPTEQKAWAKAHDVVSRIEDRVAANGGAIDVGDQVIPIVREEVAKRDKAAAA
jgi:alkanesulfonate monooxygenase